MSTAPSSAPRHPVWGIAVFAFIAIVGLFYVKWSPYAGRMAGAASTHSIGASILAGADAAPPAPSLRAALDYAIAYGLAIWKAMVLGLLLGSAVQALIPRRWVQRLLGGAGAGSVVAGSLLAVPSMTCCSAPVVNGLRRRSAGCGSAVAYWLGNPMLNPATLIFMGFVIGWHWVGLRLVLGFALVLGVGWAVNRIAAGPTAAALPMAAVAAELPEDSGGIFRRWMRSLGAMTLAIIPEYLIIVLLLGAARAWLFPALDLSVDNSMLWIVGLALAGTLFVIPTAGEVPIVQAALALGMAAGPAAALLVTLPAVSLPSLIMVRRAFSPKALALVVGAVFASGLLAALIAIGLGF